MSPRLVLFVSQACNGIATNTCFCNRDDLLRKFFKVVVVLIGIDHSEEFEFTVNTNRHWNDEPKPSGFKTSHLHPHP